MRAFVREWWVSACVTVMGIMGVMVEVSECVFVDVRFIRRECRC